MFVGAFLYWTVSPIFIDTRVEEALPEILLPKDGPNDRELTQQLSTNVYPIVDTPLHPANGSVKIVKTGDETIVRYENYEGTNGPDLYVYLAKDLEAKEFVSLGQAKGNLGNLNYTVPNGVDIREYRYVLTWCRAFGVLFDYAEIK